MLTPTHAQGTRDNIVGDIRKIPVPKKHAFDGVNRAAKAYLAAVSSDPSPAKLDALLLQVDAEVLKLYSLPLDLEQRVLGLFQRLETCRHPIFANSILADRA